jgi:hypothetical protein
MLSKTFNSGNTKEVFIQDTTSPLFQYYLMTEEKTDITLTSDINIDDVTFEVSADHGITTSHYLALWEGSAFEQVKVAGVSTNTITVELPFATAFSALGTQIVRGKIDLAIDTTGTDFYFKMYNNAQIPIDIGYFVLTMQHGANVPDDGKFGGIDALTNGIYFRQVDGTRINLGNYKTNQDFKDRGAIVSYTEKAPAGTNGTSILFDIKSTFGQVMRINPRLNDYFIGRLRDELETEGMVKFTISLLGSYTQGE